MSSLCCWCKEYHSVPQSKQSLCSVCTKLYETGWFEYRCNPPSARDYCMHNGTIKAVSELVLSDPGTIHFLSHPHWMPLAEELYDCLSKNNIWLSAQTAAAILKRFKPLEDYHCYEHAVCCRVIDYWNINKEEHGLVSTCYYSNQEQGATLADVSNLPGSPDNRNCLSTSLFF